MFGQKRRTVMRLYISGSVRKIASTVMPSVSEASLLEDPSFHSGRQASCLSLRSGRRLMRRSLAIETVSQPIREGGRGDPCGRPLCSLPAGVIVTQSLSLGMTKRRAGMTKRRAQSDSLFYLSWNECEASHKKALQFFV